MGKKKEQNVITPAAGEERVVPVVEEELAVGKRMVETGAIRIRKTVREQEAVADEPLLKEEVLVERIPVNRYIETPATVRHEDGVIIVPLMEEVLVVEKRLLLREELHIAKRAQTVRSPQRVALRSEEADVEHIDLRHSASEKKK